MQTIPDAQWIEVGGGGWFADTLRGFMGLQGRMLGQFTEEERQRAYGFACRLIVDGPGGGIFLLWFCQKGIQPKPLDVPVRNQVYIPEQTVFDMINPELESLGGLEGLADLIDHEGMANALLKLRPRLPIQKAISNQEIIFDGERPDIDQEMWARIFDNMLKIVFPMVVRGLYALAKKKR